MHGMGKVSGGRVRGFDSDRFEAEFCSQEKRIMAIEDLWYKNAIIYCLDVETFMDANGDGVGDFTGLSRRLDYLAGLGVTCVWLQPFYASPNRDNGYDVMDYYSVDRRHGTLGDFVEFMNHARAVGIRVIVDLVVNHTSVQHPWFQSARKGPRSPRHDWYVWAKERPEDHATGMVFPGYQHTTWTRDKVARKYYFHRFYEDQPDLNTQLKAVREEINRIMGFWLELGISGFRLDAVPFLIERKGAGVEPVQDFELLHEMREFLQWRCRDAILLGEANVLPAESGSYFGDRGDRLQMMLNFPVNQRLFYALATGDVQPLCSAIQETSGFPSVTQWVQFLRSHDECDLGRLTDAERERVFEAMAPEKQMQLYGRGIRRRLAPMLGNDRRRLDLAFSLLFALPGTPMLQYGDEIGIGDDLSLPQRECARTPMQWTNERHGGFSLAKKIVRPVIRKGEYSFKHLNAAEQRRDPESLLSQIERFIQMRRECPEISWGTVHLLETKAPGVLGLRYDWKNISFLTLHNCSGQKRTITFRPENKSARRLVNVFQREESVTNSSGEHQLELEPYGWRWFRAGAADTAILRSS
jgi:maltose alpha-D-glucosyltransferase / alpha-amylase